MSLIRFSTSRGPWNSLVEHFIGIGGCLNGYICGQAAKRELYETVIMHHFGRRLVIRNFAISAFGIFDSVFDKTYTFNLSSRKHCQKW